MARPDELSALEAQVEVLREQVRTLETALESNREIGAAIGILMQRHSLTQPVAFAVLARVSQRLNQPLRELARGLVLTGELPTLPASRDARRHRPDRSGRREPAGRVGSAYVAAGTSRESR